MNLIFSVSVAVLVEIMIYIKISINKITQTVTCREHWWETLFEVIFPWQAPRHNRWSKHDQPCRLWPSLVLTYRWLSKSKCSVSSWTSDWLLRSMPWQVKILSLTKILQPLGDFRPQTLTQSRGDCHGSRVLATPLQSIDHSDLWRGHMLGNIIDFSKAFDRVNYWHLFIGRGGSSY